MRVTAEVPHASSDYLASIDAGYLYPHPRGGVYHDIKYTAHALERMAPCSADIVNLLVERAMDRIDSTKSFEDINDFDEETGLTSTTLWWEKFCPKPRGILPEIVEAEIRRPFTTNYIVVTSTDGIVVTVYSCDSDPSVDEFADNQLILQAREKLKKYARLVKSRQSQHAPANASEVHVKAQREEMIGRVMKHVRKLTPSMDVKAKDWEKDMAKTKQKRNTKQIDMSIVKANKAIMKAAEKEAKNTPKTNNSSNMKVNYSKSQDVVSTAAAGSDGDDTTTATNNADKVDTTVEVITDVVAVVAQEAVVKAECDTTVPLSWEDFA